MTVAAVNRHVYDFVDALFTVYLVMIFVRVLLTWVPRMPYNRYLRATVGFIEECVDPYLNAFRAVLRPIGVSTLALDLSPIVATIVLVVVRDLVLNALLGQ
jgi:YggT family protein